MHADAQIVLRITEERRRIHTSRGARSATACRAAKESGSTIAAGGAHLRAASRRGGAFLASARAPALAAPTPTRRPFATGVARALQGNESFGAGAGAGSGSSSRHKFAAEAQFSPGPIFEQSQGPSGTCVGERRHLLHRSHMTQLSRGSAASSACRTCKPIGVMCEVRSMAQRAHGTGHGATRWTNCEALLIRSERRCLPSLQCNLHAWCEQAPGTQQSALPAR